MEVGLSVEYDGKKNIVFSNGVIKEYPIGGLICEYARFRPTELKQIILENPYFRAENIKEKSADALMHFYNELFEIYGPVIAELITTEFSKCFRDYICADKSELKKVIAECNSNKKDGAIEQFILENTGFDEFGLSTLGQAFLTAYSTFSYGYVVFKHIFKLFVSDEYEGDQAEQILSLYAENSEFQHMEFCIMLYDGKFHSIYTISSTLSLIVFEMAHAIDNDTKIVKCKNCNNYFVPVGRSDAIYCSYPSPQDPEKACRDIGAQVTRTKMAKNDVVTTEYRRLYMRLKMRLNRHPEDTRLQEKLTQLTSEMKVLRKQRAEGTVSSDDILEWISSIDEDL